MIMWRGGEEAWRKAGVQLTLGKSRQGGVPVKMEGSGFADACPIDR